MQKKIKYSDLYSLTYKFKTKINYPFYLELIKQEWNNIVGDVLYNYSFPYYIQKNQLYIACENKVYQEETKKYAVDIIKHIQKFAYFINGISTLDEKYYWRIKKKPIIEKRVPHKFFKEKHSNSIILEKLMVELAKIKIE